MDEKVQREQIRLKCWKFLDAKFSTTFLFFFSLTTMRLARGQIDFGDDASSPALNAPHRRIRQITPTSSAFIVSWSNGPLKYAR